MGGVLAGGSKGLEVACESLRSGCQRQNPWHAASCLRVAGLQVQSVEGPEPVEMSTDEFLCSSCGTWWPSRGSLAQHRRRAHNDVAFAVAARTAATSHVCPSCGIDFFSRVRVCRHLKWGAAACREALLSGALPAESPEEVFLADERDRAMRAARRKCGMSAVAGPRVYRGG